MGINRRNADYVLKYNKRSLYPIVDDKIITKERAVAAGMQVPEMYGIISTEKEISKLDQIIGGRSDFVVKPAQGAGGDGILVIADRFEDRYRTISGRIISHDEIEHQISSILTGLYSLGGHRDRALIEYRVTPDQIFKSISYEGVPDIRIIVLMGYPVMAMLRLPTRQSGGKANLHQGAIGVGVDLATGTTLRGTWLNNIISKHPDTTNAVDGVQLRTVRPGLHRRRYGAGPGARPADPGTQRPPRPEYPDRQRLRTDPSHPRRRRPAGNVRAERSRGNPGRTGAVRAGIVWACLICPL
jgi:alpha-L-glutamate ligase-like protein